MTPPSRDDLARMLDERGLGEYTDRVLATAKPAVRLITTPTDEDLLPVGATKFGGRPDLPDDAPWPTYLTRTLAFLAQINLAELPADQVDDWPLPTAGILSFWFDTATQPWGYDPKDAGSFQTLWFPPGTQLSRRDYPEFVPGEMDEEPFEEWKPYTPCKVDPEVILTIKTEGLMNPSTPDAHWDALEAVRDRLQGAQPWHWLLGNPNVIQNPMESECQLASNGIYCGGPLSEQDQTRAQSLEAGAADWRLLLQIDTDDDGTGWMWGDSGCLYYWIRKQELKERDFSNIWGVLQCF